MSSLKYVQSRTAALRFYAGASVAVIVVALLTFGVNQLIM